VRLFGLGGWFADRFEETWLGAIAELWEKRRDVVPQMVQAVLPVMAVEALGFWLVGRAAVADRGAADGIGLGALVVYAAAIYQSYAARRFHVAE
jgi:hypothetical protein